MCPICIKAVGYLFWVFWEEAALKDGQAQEQFSD